MRDFRNAKDMARALRDALKSKTIETTHAKALEPRTCSAAARSAEGQDREATGADLLVRAPLYGSWVSGAGRTHCIFEDAGLHDDLTPLGDLVANEPRALLGPDHAG